MSMKTEKRLKRINGTKGQFSQKITKPDFLKYANER